MKKYIQCYIEIEGMHRWENAPRRFEYLSHLHRHTFKIRTVFEVIDDNRQIEFIQKERDIKNFLLKEFGDEEGLCNFGGMACEHIAKKIIQKFHAEACQVLEDGEGGALYVREESEGAFRGHWIDQSVR